MLTADELARLREAATKRGSMSAEHWVLAAYLVNNCAAIEEALRDRERLAGSIRAAVTTLGTGECAACQCDGCKWEHQEAVGILRAAIDAARKEGE